MDEIKFRQPIWEDGKLTKWHYWGFRGGKIQFTINQHESYLFTGKKDKKGKEIYEGDFLKDDNNLYLIKWSEEQAGIMIARKGWMYDHFITEMNDLKELEVVGNILENPELLSPLGSRV
ncbi:MAG: YopX family protein [Candidatus Ratteibacteria bacterium]|nr:YopX family protein [Candidatus Ratteibacteria bacterium]